MLKVPFLDCEGDLITYTPWRGLCRGWYVRTYIHTYMTDTQGLGFRVYETVEGLGLMG